jgi:hypothetical protein
MTHPLPCEHQEGYLSVMHASGPDAPRELVIRVQRNAPVPRCADLPDWHRPVVTIGGRRLEVDSVRIELQSDLQHLSGIHPPGGMVVPAEPVVQRIEHPGGIGPPPTESQQRWAAARDDRMPNETDTVQHVYQPDAA